MKEYATGVLEPVAADRSPQSLRSARILVAALWLLALVTESAHVGGLGGYLLGRPMLYLLLIAAWISRPSGSRLGLRSAFLFSVLTVVVTATTADVGAAERAITFALLAWVTADTATAMDDRSRRLVCSHLIAIASLEAVVCLSQQLLHWPTLFGYLGTGAGPLVGSNEILQNTQRSYGTTGHPIVAGYIIGIGIVVLLSRLQLRRLLHQSPLAVILCAGLVATGTRSAILAVLACVAIFIISPRHSALRPGQRLALLMAVALASSPILALIARIRSSLSGTISLTNRIDSWDLAKTFLSSSDLPHLTFGNGFANAEQMRALDVYSGAFAVDNTVVTTLLNLGVVGVALLVAIVVNGYRRGGPTERLLLVFTAVMLFSFDLTQWLLPTAILFLVAHLGRNGAIRERS